ncbi:hypothetical protein AN403_4569 [Pseudomonas fluorescens]|uniref:Protein GltF n=1 Tax=Pseudomonas fluorescens TaxID=294 RepID=A0A0N8NXQ4_PSEFL|nr:DUF1120 domain-containing protein [Pseudomonas fluorescens]KPU60849.1 hypothetical protein AN403_4569 [Pseudomonas fluorescens]
MKKYFAALTTTALISAAPFALAASSTDLTVTGLITPVACTPTLSSSGVIDLGKISSGDLLPDRNTKVGTDPLQLTVTCDAVTKFAVNPIDNTHNAGFSGSFGLGKGNKGEELGFYHPRVMKVMDGATVLDPIESADDGTTWAKADHARPGYLLSQATVGTTAPANAQNVTIDFEVDSWIARADSLDLTNEITIDGSATLEVKYL